MTLRRFEFSVIYCLGLIRAPEALQLGTTSKSGHVGATLRAIRLKR